MKRILVEAGFVSAIIFTAYGIISIPAALRQLSVEVFPVPTDTFIIKNEQLSHVNTQPILYRTIDRVQLSAKELDCLARNIYHEAGIESRAGKLAVAQVTHNRLRDGRWGNDVCKVVYAKAQFSWTLDKRKVNAKLTGELWESSKQAAQDFVNGKRVDRLGDSLHYHAVYVNPKWADTDKKVHQVGQHIFYALVK